MNPTFVTCRKQTEINILELQNLGFRVNDKKLNVKHKNSNKTTGFNDWLIDTRM